MVNLLVFLLYMTIMTKIVQIFYHIWEVESAKRNILCIEIITTQQ